MIGKSRTSLLLGQEAMMTRLPSETPMKTCFRRQQIRPVSDDESTTAETIVLPFPIVATRDQERN